MTQPRIWKLATRYGRTPAKHVRKKKTGKRRVLAVLLSLAVLLPLISPDAVLWLLDQLSFMARAEIALPSAVDGSTGTPSYDWYTNGDSRYDAAYWALLGDADHPYILRDGDEMKGLANVVNGEYTVEGADSSFLGKFLKFDNTNPDAQGKIIDLVNYSGWFYLENGVPVFQNSYAGGTTDYFGWKSIGYDEAHAFRGTFDANGHEIRNLGTNASAYVKDASNPQDQISYPYEVAGLFGFADFSGGGSLTGFRLTDVQIGVSNSGVTAGALVAKLIPNKQGASLTDCSVTGRAPNDALASFTVAARDNIRFKVASGGTTLTLTSRGKPGEDNCTAGLVGCVQKSDAVLAENAIGMFNGCRVDSAEIIAQSGIAGGLAGYADIFNATSCSFQGSLTAGSAALEALGGLLSRASSSAVLTDCSAMDAVITVDNASATTAAVGGLLGWTPDAVITGGGFTGAIYTASYGNTDANLRLAGTGGILGRATSRVRINGCTVGSPTIHAVITESSVVGNRNSIGHVGGILGSATMEADAAVEDNTKGGAALDTRIENCQVYISINTRNDSSKNSSAQNAFVGGVAGCIALPYYTYVKDDGKSVLLRMYERADESRAALAANQPVIRNCVVKGDIAAQNQTGGIAGLSFADIEGCTFEGTISGRLNINADNAGSGNGVGGLAGDFCGAGIRYSQALAAITVKPVDRTTGVGGIAGRVTFNTSGAYAVIQNCLFSGSIDADDSASGSPGNHGIGGVVGFLRRGAVRRCIVNANMDMAITKAGPISVGGVIGFMNTPLSVPVVSECITAGYIRIANTNGTQENRIGGLIGMGYGCTGGNDDKGTMVDSLSAMTLFGNNLSDQIGGLLGYHNNGSGSSSSNLTLRCLFVGAILSPWGGSLFGALNGAQPDGSAGITSAYYDRSVSPNAFASFVTNGKLAYTIGSTGYLGQDGVHAKTTAELASSSLTGLGDKWTLTEGAYPRLSWVDTQDVIADLNVDSLWQGFQALAAIVSRPAFAFSGSDHALCVSGAVTPRPDTDGVISTWAEGGVAVEFPAKTGAGLGHELVFTASKDGWAVTRPVRLLGAPSFAGGNNGLRRYTTAGAIEAGQDKAFHIVKPEDVEAWASYVNMGGGFLGGWFLLDADLSMTAALNTPIGTSEMPFCGRFDGQSHTMTGLVIDNMPAGSGGVYIDGYGGLFGTVVYGSLADFALEAPTVSTRYNGVGILAGYGRAVQIGRCTVHMGKLVVNTHDNSGLYYRGGLVGALSKNSKIQYSSFTGDIENANFAGGLVGSLEGSSTMDSCYVVGNIGRTGFDLDHFRNDVGGLAGKMTSGTIAKSFAMGNIAGKDNVGGLVGNAGKTENNSTMKGVYFYGNVNGNNNVGGLVGNGLNIVYYNTNGTVKSTVRTTLTDAYFVGQITHSGLAGTISGSDAYTTETSNVYYNKEISGLMTAFGGVTDAERDGWCGKTTQAMTAGALSFSSGTLSQGAGRYPYFDRFGSAWKGSESLRADALLASVVSTQSIYDFLEQSNAYILKNDFTVSRPSGTDPAFQVTIQEPDNMDGSGFGRTEEGNQIRYTYAQNDTKSGLYLFEAVCDTTFVYPGLTIHTKIVVVPFKVGAGTAESPFEIPDVPTLKAFRDYINQGTAPSGAYYKLTMREATAGAHDVYDLTGTGEWYPIGGILPDSTVTSQHFDSATTFDGHFIGNNHTIKGMQIGSPDSPTAYNGRGGMTAGFFGSIKGGSVEDLTIQDAAVYVCFNARNFTAGILAGVAHSAELTNIAVIGGILRADDTYVPTALMPDLTISGLAIGGLCGEVGTQATVAGCLADVQLTYTESGGVAGYTALGGLIGRIASTEQRLVQVSQCIARADMTGTDSSRMGGIAGEALTVTNSSASEYVTIEDSASYGNYEGFAEGGGVIGHAEGMGHRLTNVVSTADLFTASPGTAHASGKAVAVRLGGLYGMADQVKLENTVYGGRLSVKDGAVQKAYIGGLVGFLYLDSTSYILLSVSDSVYDCSLNAYLVQEDPAASDYATLVNYNGLGGVDKRNYIDVKLYNPQLKPFQSASAGMRQAELCGDTVTPGTRTAFTCSPYLYPYPQFVDQADARRQALVKAGSVALYYTWSGAASNQRTDGSRQEYLSSVYVKYADAQLDIEQAEAQPFAATRGQKRLVAETPASGAADRAAVLRVTFAGAQGKKMVVCPDSTASGKTDFSFYAANPEGDGLDAAGAAGTFTLYNADQLQGLAALVAAQTKAVTAAARFTDGNGNGVNMPAGADFSRWDFAGFTVYIGADMDARMYPSWKPIGTSGTPFRGSLDGKQHGISSLNLTGPDCQGLIGYMEAGASGSIALRDVGILDVRAVSSQASHMGSLLGYGEKVAISGCFSDARIDNLASGAAASSGGLVGVLKGGSVENCFFTGSVAVPDGKAGVYAGGLVGEANSVSFSQCYTAGMVEAGAGHYGALAGKALQSTAEPNCYIDMGACGRIDAAGEGALSAETVSTAQITTAADGQKPVVLSGFLDGIWEFRQGLYPMLQGYDPADATIAAIPVTLDSHARSVTTGRVSYGGAVFVQPEGQTFYELLDGNRVLQKTESGDAYVELQYGGHTRLIYMQMRCWYEMPETVGDKTVYTIVSPNELQEFAWLVSGHVDRITHKHKGESPRQDSFAQAEVRLGADIDMALINNAVPIGTAAHPFAGTFNGQGYTISNLTLSGLDASGAVSGEVGLFGATDGAVLQDVGLSGGSIAYTEQAAVSIGGLVGAARNTQIIGCFNAAPITIASSAAVTVGGLVGTLSDGSTVSGCYNMAAVTVTGNADAKTGGIAGRNAGVISLSYNTGMLKAAAGGLGGIAGVNSGNVQNSYNAALLEGAAKAPIAPDGTVTGCVYERQHYDKADTDALSGVKDVSGSGLTGKPAALGGDWTVAEGHYPQIPRFTSGTEGQYLASSVSSAAVLLKKAAGNASYKSFESAVMVAEDTWGGELYAIGVIKTSTGGDFDIQDSGGQHVLSPTEEGPTTLTASIRKGSVIYKRDVYLIVVQMLNVRYRFDFSKLASQPANRTAGYLTRDTFLTEGNGTAGSPYRISTAADLIAFSQAVAQGSQGGGEDVYVSLAANIDMSGKSLPPIGSEAAPFTGTFDGCGYTIDNLTMTGEVVGLFGWVGQGGKVKRVGLRQAVMTLGGAGDQVGGLLAAVNEGSLQSCYVRGEFTVNTPQTSRSKTYAGALVGWNKGRMSGCYFRPPEGKAGKYSAVHSNIATRFASTTYFGMLAGYNAGTMTGCYHTSDLEIPRDRIQANGIAGYSAAGGVSNCFYDTMNGSIAFWYAFDSDEGAVAAQAYEKTTADIQTEETALRLSFDLYLGMYELAAGVNDGYPSLQAFSLIQKRFPAFGSDPTILFNLQNTLKEETKFTVMNAVCSYEEYLFPLFGKIPISGSLLVNLPDLPKDMQYAIAEVKAYGRDEQGGDEVMDLSWAGKTISASAMPNRAYQINITILLEGGTQTDPWGVHQKWSSTVTDG